MKLFLLVCFWCLTSLAADARNWPSFRGPQAAGVAAQECITPIS